MRRRLAAAGVVLAAALITLWLLTRLFAWGACSWYGYQTERNTRYAAFVGCLVEVNGRWIPRNELRVVQ
jgi:hypothetical protein